MTADPRQAAIDAIAEGLARLRDFGYQPMHNGRPSCPFCEQFVDDDETHAPSCPLLDAAALRAYLPGDDLGTALAEAVDLPRPGDRPVVDCDDQCGALEDPVTFDEHRAALRHWQEHGLLFGCSHAR